MTFDEYRAFVEALPYGKRLPTAVYVYRSVGCRFGDEMDRLLLRLRETLGAGDEFNVLKFHRNELKLSLRKIDWQRTNTKAWEGRAFLDGKVSKAMTNVVLTGNLIKQVMGLPLLAHEEEIENAHHARRAAR